MSIKIKDLTFNAIIAALYVILTLISYPFSFGQIQFRLAEIFILLCFFNPNAIIGLSIGCFIANLFSSIGIVDALIGVLATIISCLIIMKCKHLIFACIIPVVTNGLIIGLELNLFLQENFLFSVLCVSVGELLVMVFAYILFAILKKRQDFYSIINATQNINYKF